MKPPPNKRPNWHKLNEGQRRYAWEQYNLALVRRGIPIDHPVPDREETLEETALRELQQGTVQDLGGEELDELADQFEELQGEMPSVPQKTSATATPDVGSSSDIGEPANKKRKANGGSKLPGTGKGQGEGTPEGIEGGPRAVQLPRPSISIHSEIRFFRKVHRFLTYGIAYDIIKQNNWYWMTTPLCKIPWDRAYFYLTPSEFHNLSDGAHVTKCRVQVHCRNVRVAFPTNASETVLATLNQNKKYCCI